MTRPTPPRAALFASCLLLAVPASAQTDPGNALEFLTLGQSASTAAGGWIPQAFTVEGWFRVDAYTISSATTGGGLVTLGAGSTQVFSLWAISSISTPGSWRPMLQINYNNTSTTRFIRDDTFFPADDQVWRHIAATYDGSVATLMLDGEVIAQEAWNTPFGSVAGTSLGLGAEIPGAVEYLDGAMDEVRVWEVARTVQQIQDHYQSEVCPDESGLWAYYKFEEGALTLDSSSNGRDLATNGSPAASGAGQLGACVDCAADVNTTNTNPGDAGYGEPDDVVDGADLSYFVENWLAQNAAVADVNTTNTNPGDAGYGSPDGVVDGADLSFFVESWLAGCP